ncbi:MAG: regulatory protein RecX [Oscillospiraceae bacterium]|nr:regulatory protein RecX [Oscillospiraceae bacterium]
MPEALCIEALKQVSPERVGIRLSDGEEIASTLGVVAELRLCAGLTLDEERLEAIKTASALALLKTKALELLSRRPMSAKELRVKLLQKGAEPGSAEACVRWLEEHRLLDDEAYAGAVVRHYASKGCGEGRIRQELSRRGVPREYWDEALAQRPDSTEKIDKLIAARLHDPENRDEVRKVTAALYRRGFGWDEIRAALARFRAEADYEED